jgi:hypothetical protein
VQNRFRSGFCPEKFIADKEDIMSMRVKIAMQGITDLEILLAALQDMEIMVAPTLANETSKGTVLAIASIQGRKIGFSRSQNGEIAMRGDSDWPIMKNTDFRRKLKQHYSLATVKKTVAELRYNLASVDTLEDGSIKVVARAWR